MPHSSGGGSHGGGSHGGGGHSHSHSSHHSGGGSSGGLNFASTRVSHKPYRYCTTYCYYKDRKPVYIYSSASAKDKQSVGNLIGRIVTWILCAPMFGLLTVLMLFGSVTVPHKLEGKYSKDIIIDDRIDIMTDREEDELYDTLKAFYKKTGIVPAVITVNNEDWVTDDARDNLERYAYKEYLRLFKDEKHWLIVYSEPENVDDSFNDWYWEGMQGDDTDKILSQKKTLDFTNDLHKNLLKNDIGVAESISMSFEKVTKAAMKIEVDWFEFGFVLVPGSIFVWLTIYLLDIHPFKKALLKKAFKVKDSLHGVVKEETCEYCGGVYVIGCHLSCPHCGGQIKAHDYTVDSEGNVTNVLT